jgi:hypothetical protein
MYTWQYLLDNVNKKQDLLRLESVQKKYINDKIKILKKYKSYEDFIKIKYLNYDSINIIDKIESIENKNIK